MTVSFYLPAIAVALSASVQPATQAEITLDARQDFHPAPLPGWNPVGCFTDSAGARTLKAQSFVTEEMTPGLCMQFCGNTTLFPPSGFGFAGVEFTNECFCDGIIQLTGNITDPSECNLLCEGDEFFGCGGSNRISIFTNGTPSPKIPTAASPMVDDPELRLIPVWNYVGCYSDSPMPNRTLERMVGSADINQCPSLCQAAFSATITDNPNGFPNLPAPLYAGIEFGGECWCGTSVASSAKRLPDIACESMGCFGLNDQACGGEFIMAIYESPGATDAGTAFSTCDPAIRPFSTFQLQAESLLDQQIFPITMVSTIQTEFSTGGNATTIIEAGILSHCPTCAELITFNLTGTVPSTTVPEFFGIEPLVLTVEIDSDSAIRPETAPPPGGIPNFLQITDPLRTFGGYCIADDGNSNRLVLVNPAKPLTLPLTAPPNSTFDPAHPWVICQNLTAVPPTMDVVFKQLTFQPGFNLTDCQDIKLVMLIPGFP